MRLLIDQDEVLAQFTAKVLQWWNEDQGENAQIEDIKTYHIQESLGPKAHYFIKSCMRFPDFFTSLEPVPGAIEGMKQLVEMGHDVVIVTKIPTSAPGAYHGKMEWVRKHLPFLSVKNIVGCQRKELVQGDLLLDDSPKNVYDYLNCGRKIIIFDRPWNRDIKEFKHVPRVHSWDEFIKQIKIETVRDNFMAKWDL